VLHQIGSGVLGPVFRTYDPQHDRVVAVKVFRLDVPPEQTASLVDVLRRLAAPDAALPGLAHALEAGLEGTMAYLASEYVPFETFDVALRHLAPMPLERALPIVSQIADALDAAAACGVMHGALHPRDVFLTGEGEDICITGCGIIQALEAVGLKAPLRRPYTAPERAAGAPWDHRADIYSLGALTHELLTRRRPGGSGEQDGALANDMTAEQRVQIRRAISVVLAERPEDRYASARAFADALAGIARGETLAFAETVAVLPVSPEAAEESEGAQAELEQFAVEEHPAPFEPIATSAASIAPLVEQNVEHVESNLPAGQQSVSATAHPLLPTTGRPLTIETDEAFVDEFRPDVPEPDTAFDRSPMAEAAPNPHAFSPGPAVSKSASPPPSGFPWSVVGAVAAAGIAVGVVFEYQYLRRPASEAAALTAPGPTAVGPSKSSTTETEVQVPANAPVLPSESAAVPPSTVARGETASPASPSRPTAPAASIVKPPPPRRSAREVAVARGRLVVRSVPAGALVRVDGHARGQTPATLADVPFGRHTVEIAHSGFVPHTEVVTLSTQTPVHAFSVSLRPGLAIAASSSLDGGSMFVDSRPQHARILVDGRFVGVTPLRVSELPRGQHAVRLELPGYQPFATTVGINAGQQSWVTASLEEHRD
jgi:serine/threonine protein kinase